MRAREQKNGLRLQAIAGTHVALLGWDIVDETVKSGLLGFAIQREDHTEQETYWLRGMKSFPNTYPPLPPGGDAATREQPIQGFQWGDYTAKAGHEYTYTLVPMYGEPGALTEGDAVSVTVTCEQAWGHPHSVFFNRGAVASQEYARRFSNRPPNEVGEPAYTWLSRGLLEAIVAFIERANDSTYALRAAIYEFQWPDVLDAFEAAIKRKVDVNVIYDAIPKQGGPKAKNQAALKEHQRLQKATTPFTHGTIMHNKFIVLLKDNEPLAVWTGSTNITEGGIFGMLDVGHAIEDPELAKTYLEYWAQLSDDPDKPAPLKAWCDSNTPPPPKKIPDGVTPEFSPQSGLDTLQGYADITGSAAGALFMTFAFGMNGVFQDVFKKNDNVLRYALMEKEGNGAGLARGKIDVANIRKRANVLVAVGHNISLNAFDHWLAETNSAIQNAHVLYVHTKFALVDPLSDSPIVITGSANFSDASTNRNEENMLIIRGDARVADIYLGEFMRSFAHYAFREAVYLYARQKGKSAKKWTPQYLATDNSWLIPYFKKGSANALKRQYFSG